MSVVGPRNVSPFLSRADASERTIHPVKRAFPPVGRLNRAFFCCVKVSGISSLASPRVQSRDERDNRKKFRRDILGERGSQVVKVLIAYPLSIGPLCWLESHDCIPEWCETPIEVVYYPVGLMTERGPEPVRRAFYRYCHFWNEKIPPSPPAR